MACKNNAQRTQTAAKSPSNVGLCNTCQARVPATFIKRDGQVFIRKECPKCGPNESLVSSEEHVWQGKRDLWQYVPTDPTVCTLHCDRCQHNHNATIVFVDVTNRCNLNCPICIANVRGMGFEYHPPLSYFEKIFAELGKYYPTPVVELFGGEPTMREDLLEIIKIARTHGVKPRVVTNGIRLADEAYCRELCEAGIRFRFAFDGRSPEIYKRLRRSSNVYEKKMKALANLAKYSRRKHAIVSCVARNINEQYIGDLIDFCHENKNLINELGMIPLTENWPEGEFEHVDRTTPEDAEHIVEQSIRGGGVEFIPAGIVYCLRKARLFFKAKSRSELLRLGGVHPNCESFTLLISDGEHYRSTNHFFKIPTKQFFGDLLALGRKIDTKLSQLDPQKRTDRLRGQLLVLRTYLPLVWRTIDVKHLFKGHLILNPLRILAGMLMGKSARDMMNRYGNPFQVLRIAILPFEEYHSIDGARLENCTSVFVYEDVNDGQIKQIPACTWYLYRNELLRQVADKWGTLATRTEAPASQDKAYMQEPASPKGVRLPVPKMPSAVLTSGKDTRTL